MKISFKRFSESADQKQEAIAPFREHHKLQVDQHIDDWRDNLDDRGVAALEAQRHVGRVRRTLEACGFQRIPDLDPVDCEAYLAKRRSAKKKPMAAQTHNFYVQSLRRFSKWLVDRKRTDQDRLAENRRHDESRP